MIPRILVLFFLHFAIGVIEAQNPGWLWAGSFSEVVQREDENIIDVFSIAIDTATNDVYTTGYFFGEIDFDPGPLEFTMTSTYVDMFVTKMDVQGNLVWAKQVGGEGSGVSGYGVTVAATGNVLITGGFSWHPDFDPGSGDHSVWCNGESDIFLLQLSSDGDFQWVKNIGGVLNSSWGNDVIVETTTGNIFVTGCMSGINDFDPGPGEYYLGDSSQDYDIFICKLDSTGQFIWARDIQGQTVWHFTMGMSIAVHPYTGSVFLAGVFWDACDFDPGISTYMLTSNGESDVFVLKLGDNGNFLWAHSFGGVNFDHGPSLALGGSEEEIIYLSGGFSGGVDFDPGEDELILASAGSTVIAKFLGNKNLVWAKELVGTFPPNEYNGSMLALDTLSAETILLTGGFGEGADFDPGQDTIHLFCEGSSDVFVARLDSAGHYLWAQSAGGISYDIGKSIAIDHGANSYITGNFDSNECYFDSFTLVNQNTSDVFVSKLGGCSTVVISSEDNGLGTFRHVVSCADPGAEITFDLGPMSQITLTTGELIIDKDLIISGPGIEQLTISGNSNSRIFHLLPDNHLHLSNLSLKHGFSGQNGGAIFMEGTLTLDNILLQHNYESILPKSLSLGNATNLFINGIVSFK